MSDLDAILANLSSGLAAAERGNDSAMSSLILNLSSSDPNTQERSIREIINLTLSEQNREEVRKNDGIAPIIKLLSTGQVPILQVLAAHALTNLTLTPSCCQGIVQLGAIPALANAARSGNETLMERAYSALCNLCISDDSNRVHSLRERIHIDAVKVIASGVVSPLAIAALMFISNAAQNATIGDEAVREGALDIAVRLLPTNDTLQKKYTIALLSALSTRSVAYNTIVSLIGQLTDALKTADEETQMKILVILVNTSGTPNGVNEIIKSGAINEIVKHLHNRNQILAIQALQNLALSESTREYLARAGVGEAVAQILARPNDRILHVLNATTNLSCNADIRRAMCNLGALENVAKYINDIDNDVAHAAKQAHNNLSVPYN